QRIGVEPVALGELGGGRALLAERVGDAEVRNHVQAACGDVPVCEVDQNLRGGRWVDRSYNASLLTRRGCHGEYQRPPARAVCVMPRSPPAARPASAARSP